MGRLQQPVVRRQARGLRVLPPSTPPPGRAARVVNALMLGLAVLAGVLCLRVKGNYAWAPWIGLIAPISLSIISRRVRERFGRQLQSQFEAIHAFRLRGGPLPWRAALILVALPSFLLNLSNNDVEGSGDTRPVLPTAVSLVTQGNLDLDEFDQPAHPANLFGHESHLPYYLVRSGGHVYSAYPAGMVTLAAPVAALARLAGADLHLPQSQSRLEKLVGALASAISLALFSLIAVRTAPIRVAMLATLMLGLGSGLFSTVAQGAWQHDGIILAMLAVLLVEVTSQGYPGWAGVLVQGVACGLLPTFRLTSATFLIPFGLWMVWKAPRRGLAVIGLAILTFTPWAIWYWSIYGSPFGPSSVQMGGSHWTGQLAWPLVGLLVSPGRGLIVYQPWVVLSSIALLPSVWRRVRPLGVHLGPSGLPWLCAGVVGTHILVIACWRIWYGGYCWGSRLIVETQPLLALMTLPALTLLCQSRRGKALAGSLVLAGILMQVPGVYLLACRWNNAVQIDVHPEAVWSWGDPPFLSPWTRHSAPIRPGG